MSLNMSKNAWINCSDYASVFNMLRYSYNNIIITVTNVTILELLSAQFVHPGNLEITKASKLLVKLSF